MTISHAIYIHIYPRTIGYVAYWNATWIYTTSRTNKYLLWIINCLSSENLCVQYRVDTHPYDLSATYNGKISKAWRRETRDQIGKRHSRHSVCVHQSFTLYILSLAQHSCYCTCSIFIELSTFPFLHCSISHAFDVNLHSFSDTLFMPAAYVSTSFILNVCLMPLCVEHASYSAY